MSHYALFTLLATVATTAIAQTPLVDKRFHYPDQIPYQVDPDAASVRGPQQGYNICNSTTEGPNSLCQTAFVNSVDDFCLWAPSKPNQTIGDTEGEEVAWCTKPGRGTRLIPAGALTGVQFMKTPDYLQVVGFIKQTEIDIQDGDFGGELDPHGADLRGNPLGGLMYSNGFPSNGGNLNSFQQVIEWHNFMGGNQFCMKVCDPAGAHAADYCQHIFDRIGCAYNAPNNAQLGVFESCQGDNQDFPGVYTTNGQVVTYSQPPESLGPITSIPYTARVPASSNCVTFTSSALYTNLPKATDASTSSSASSTASGFSSTKTATTTRSTASATSGSTSSGALAFSNRQSLQGVILGIFSGLVGVGFAITLLA